jgi:hypothetical protein
MISRNATESSKSLLIFFGDLIFFRSPFFILTVDNLFILEINKLKLIFLMNKEYTFKESIQPKSLNY